jgi:dTDP-4-dehydrorhamnose reductase
VVVAAAEGEGRRVTGRYLVVGSGGQLGSDLVRVLTAAGRDVTALAHRDLDVADAAAVDRAVTRWRGEDADAVVFNAAAWTDVDGAEADEPGAFRVNATGPAALAAACAAHRARLVHVSTDYVFDGTGDRPYREDAPLHPVNAYGRSKAAGEEAVLAALPAAYVVRTAWVYGAGGRNFVGTMARLASERDTVDVVDDQVGSPTWSRDLADGLVALVDAAPAGGRYHATGSGQTTWYGFACAIFEELGLDPERVRPTTSDKFPRPAPRPAFSVLADDRWRAAGLAPLPPWRDALHRAMRGWLVPG